VDACAEDRAINILRVNEVLKEIGAHDLPSLMIYNKIDQLKDVQPHIERDQAGVPIAVWVSALSGEGMDLLLQAVVERVPKTVVHSQVHLKPDQGAFRAALYSHKAVLSEQTDELGSINLEIRLPESDFLRLLNNSGLKLQDLVLV
jgi:GTP-binding protein HflX